MSKPPLDTRTNDQLSFIFPNDLKQVVSEWVNSVSHYFSTVLIDIDPQSFQHLITDAIKERSKKFEMDLNDEENDIEISHNAKFEETLEPLTGNLVVQLISTLGHFSGTIRSGSAALIAQLAEVLTDNTLDQTALSRILAAFETGETGYFNCVRDLFALIKNYMSIMVISVIAGLELYNNSTDWRIRGICNSAIAQIVYENKSKFIQEDRLTAVWNLYFSLGSIPSISTIFPDRVVIVEAFYLLSPLYAAEDKELAAMVTEAILKLPNKSENESKLIKKTLSVIFSKLVTIKVVDPNSDQPPEKMNQIPNVFLNLISSQEESAYDLLCWAIENYFSKNSTAIQGNGLQDFFMSLSNHFRAIPAIVRHGAALALLSIIRISPTFPATNGHVWQFIVAGVLESDHLCAGVYLSILEIIDIPDSEQVKNLIGILKRDSNIPISYDEIFLSNTKSNSIVTHSDLLDLIIKHSPPLAGTILHKLANSLNYVGKKQKLKQMKLLRIWGKKAPKLDMYIMQILVPLCSNSDEDIQLLALIVVRDLLPGVAGMTTADTLFLWRYLSVLLNPKLEGRVLLSAIQLMRAFPLPQLNSLSRDELVSSLFELIFHSDPAVRAEVYTFLADNTEYWKAVSMLHSVLALLFLSLGDSYPDNVKIVVDQILKMGGSFMTPILSQLNKIRDSVTSSPLNQMRVYDNLCTAMAINKIELRPLIDAMILPFRVDQFWDFFLSGIPENQLARPEDYNYKKVYIQMPIWISLFYTKFNVPPPPIGAENGARRDQMPVTPMGKRRFICGFMLTLLPCLGSYNPNLRYLSCITMIYCCFKGANGQGEMIRGLLEYSTQFLLVSKFISYQLSAIDIFAAVVRLKIPGIAESIFQEYFELCLEFLHNAHSPMIQISVLNLLEVFLLVFPKGMSTKLQEVRDIARVLMVDRDPNVVEAACKVYPLVFRAGSGIHGAEFEKFLIQELDLLEDITSPPALADPLINHLNEDQIQRIVSVSIFSLGLITDGTSSPFTTAQYLMRYLYHEKSIYRHNAFVSIINLFSVMDNLETSTVIWVLMPLYADLNYDVRLAWSRFRRNAPSFLQLRCNSILPHPDDNAILPIISWEDILTDHTSLAINHKSLQDLASPIDALVPVQSFELPKEDEGFHLPTMSVKLLARFKELLQSMTTTLPPTSQNIVLYHLDQFKEFPPLQCPMMMVLSEFGCMHDDTFKSTGHILLSHLSLDPDFDNALLLEACILGIENLLRNSRPMIAEIVEQLTTRQVLSDGDLIAISYLHGILKDLISPNLVSETVEKLSAMTSSARFPHEKRLLASHLAGEFAIHGAPDDRKTLFEALQSFLESAPPNAIKEKIYMVAGRLIQEGEVHPLFKSMAVQSKKLLKSKDPKERIQSLSIFSIFGKSLPHDDKLGYLLRYLADSNEKIRDAARDVLISEDLVSNIRPELLALPVETGRRAQLLQSGRLHTMDLVGIQINQGEQKETSQPESSTAYLPWVFGTSATEDPFNIRFFHSDLRQRYSKLYGVNELQYTRFMEPLTTGVIYEVNQRLNSCSPGNESHDQENELLKNVKPLSILEVLIKHSPSIAVNLIQNLLENIEAVAKINKTSSKGTFNEDEEDNSDVGIMTHIIDLMWNLMIAYGFKGDMVTNWLKRLREFLSVSSSTSEKLRETLYYDLEKSFYFQNQFIDIPIISDEQIAALQELRDLSQEAILDVVKSGKTEKVGLIDNKNDQWNGEVDSESDYLRRLTILSLQVLSGYGLYLSLTRDLPEDMLVDSFRFLMQFLDDEHRGFRIVLTESAVSIVSLLENFQQMPKLQDLVRDTVLTIHGRLLTESQYLYRKKADFASLISQLSVKLAPDDSVHANILSSLLELWKDPDSEVRNVSINMIQHLGEMRIPVVIKGFQDSTENSINLMKEIVILGNQEDYPEKDALQRLLKWRFSKDPNFWTLS